MAFLAQLPEDLRLALSTLASRSLGLTETGKEVLATYDAMQIKSFAAVEEVMSWEIITDLI